MRRGARCPCTTPRRNEVGDSADSVCQIEGVAEGGRKKEMVPSDPISSLARRGHATAPNIAFRSAGRHRWFAPRMPVFPASASTRSNAPQLSFSVTEPFARNGLSLARNGLRFHGFHSGVNGPGLLLRSNANQFWHPFGLSAPPPAPVSPDSSSFLASDPLRFPRPTHPAALSVSTPLRELSFPLDQSVQRASPPSGPPSDSARSPLAPRRPIYH